MNPIENLWATMAKTVYNNGKQYENVESLKKAINEAWNEISDNAIADLINGMPNRIHKLIESRGGVTGY